MAESYANLKIERDTSKKTLQKTSEEVPEFKTKIENLSDEKKKEIIKDIEAELEAIEKERQEDGLEEKLDSLDRQYEGEMRDLPNMQFNVSRRTTAIKVNAVVRALMEAFFEGDRVFTAAPRPEFDEKGGREIAEKQEDFLDYKIDEVIPLEEQMALVAHSATLKPNGILKLVMKHKRAKRKLEETYEGKWEEVLDSAGRPVVDADGKPLRKNKGLEEFLRAYPDALEKYPAHVKALQDGKKLDLVIQYDQIVYDDPMPKCVDLKNFYIRRNVEGYDGLCSTYLHAEKKEYTYWELLQEEKEERLYDIDLLTYEDPSLPEEQRKRMDKYANEKYTLWECVFHVKLDDSDDFIKCVFHINREKKTMHGSDYYPYWGFDSYYFPFSINSKKSGFYQRGIGADLTDINLAENIMLCTALEGSYVSNMITPIVKRGSRISQQFNEKTWSHGMPLEYESKSEIPDFLNKYFRPSNSSEMMGLTTFLRQDAGDVSGVSEAFATGKADPIDPSAPAQKTRDLLQQSGVNIRDYIKVFARTFNLVGSALMQMYYQRGEESYKYRIPEDKLSLGGGNPFAEITRADMAAKTNFQTLASMFDVDRLNAKKEDLALFQVVRAEPLVAGNEEAVYHLLKNIIKGWSPKWRNQLNRILPPLDIFKKQRVMIAAQGVQLYVQQLEMQAKATGVQPVIDPTQLIAAISQVLKESVTPPTKEEVKEREQAQKA